MTLDRLALGGLTAAALALAGCAGGQSSPSAMAPMFGGAQRQTHRASGSSSDVLYVLMSRKAYIVALPGLSKLSVMNGTYGNVAVSDPNNGNVFLGNCCEFAHGSKEPFAHFPGVSGEVAYDAAFDPTTDNLAFSMGKEPSNGSSGWIAVYANLNHKPTVYTDSSMKYYGGLAYDGQGDLFVLGSDASGNGSVIGELPKGENHFTNFVPSRSDGFDDASQVFWDGSYIVIRARSKFDRVAFSGSSMTVVGQTLLKGAFNPWYGSFWLQDGTIYGPHLGDAPHNGRYLGLWHYPQGGSAYAVMKDLNSNQKERITAVTLSVAPNAGRTR
ncbi:MAG TPA: hypothetical protein VHS56_00700 [Candidatus Cybelea sp.]|nr:hypothetical protein [Candidatus Cybelea sp.]